MVVSDEQVSQFETDGFLILDRIISDAQVDRTLAAMDRVYGGTYNRDIRPAAVRKPVSPFGTKQSVQWILNARIVDSDLWALATDRVLGQTVARLLRTSAASVVEDQLLAKPERAHR
jgi:hypothetical protein